VEARPDSITGGHYLPRLGDLSELTLELVDFVSEAGCVFESEVFGSYMHFLFKAHHQTS
jgi:hypothetical protein